MSELIHSRTWDLGPIPDISVVVSTFRRPDLLAGLTATLEDQDLPTERREVVYVDNGSGDGTWDELSRLVASTPMRACALRLDANHGAGGGRNRGVAIARAPIVAMTDDDCLPTTGWLSGLLAAMGPGTAVVQGRVTADPDGQGSMGPWDHTVWMTPPTPFFATCNVAYRRDAFEAAGGFDESDPLTARIAGGRAFGEDAWLGWRVVAAGGAQVAAPDALVHHRCMPGTYDKYLADRRQLHSFPALARRSPLVADWLWHRVFLARETAEVDLALAGLALALWRGSPLPALAAWPWWRRRWAEARWRAQNDRRLAASVLAKLAWGDLVGFRSLIAGSVRHRRVIL